ncbi:MAG: tetratricopeptide repeat protein [Bacteroidota bacterium]|nr:tetratricopeptide repeat protein [Bacteroidota bacterium]
MIKRSLGYLLASLVIIGFIYSCSTEKNTGISRTYHNITSHYNVYFNGNEAFKQGVLRLDNSFVENYNAILPIFKYGDETAAKMIYPDMDKAIKKCSKLIKIHSITSKPKRKKGRKSKKERKFYAKNEYNKWIDDAYLLMGKSHFYKHDFFSALESFEYMIKEYQDEPATFEAYIWIARTYNEQKEYVKAREILDLIDAKRKMPEKYEDELQITYADYYFKQEKYDDGIPYLEKTIELTRKKAIKVRYMFILAQVYQEMENYKAASLLYTKVIKKNRNYDMAFNAKLRKASSFSTSLGGGEELMKELGKMLKDDKNIEYKDQIYYAMAELSMKQGKVEEALDYYKLSAEKSVSNTNQKAITFLAMADIYFARPEYRHAQTYYDSTLFFIDPSYPDIESLSVKTKSLTKLIENLDIIDNQDSLQNVAAMSEKQRDAVIQSLINEVIEEEKRLKEEERMAEMNSALFKQQQRDPRNRNLAAGGKWYFYNPTALSFGETEFVKLWGRRKLEDNWRRKNKKVVSFGDEFGDELAEGDSVPGQKPRPTDTKSKEYYMVDLPLNDSLMKISHQNIIDAFFAVGEIYKNELNDYPLSVTTFEELNNRYPGNDYILFSYYNLYNLNNDINETAKALEYKNKIINDFPNSKYAKMFTNPNYLQEINAQIQKVINLYNDTYSLFKNKNYSTVISNCTMAEAQYSSDGLIPKFKYLKAISYGESGMLDQFVDALKDIVKNHPDSEVKSPAMDILLVLQEKGNVELPEEELGVIEKKEELVEVPAEEIYSLDEKMTHFYIVVVANRKKSINRIKYNISNFNIEFFSMKTFNISSIILNDDYQIITVKSMDNQAKALDYFASIKANPDVYKDFTETDYRHFVITSENFAAFYKDQNVEKYMEYFIKNYFSAEEGK